MQPFTIVKHFAVTEQLLFGFLARGRNAIAEVVKALGLERRPEALHQGVIITVTLATHALHNLVVLQKVTEQFTGS
jgi:hypothetical protein